MKTFVLLAAVSFISITQAANPAHADEVKYPCGLRGTIEERIDDCKLQNNNFVLVTRTEKQKEVYQDLRTGLLWSHRFERMNYDNASDACDDDAAETGYLPGISWSLPSQDEYKDAEKHGIRWSMPDMQTIFWTDTSHRKSGRFIFAYHGESTDGMGGHFSDYDSINDRLTLYVRCVGAPSWWNW